MEIPRQKTVQTRLAVDWDFPAIGRVQLAEGNSGDATVATAASQALDLSKAYAYLSSEDQRPLLILRECMTCNGTDDALLSRSESNEKTFILTRWFHCVKLPTHVLEMDHPFHNLFAGEHPPHLFVCDRDGGNAVALRGDQSQGELWAAMAGVLQRSYRKDPDKAVREVQRLYVEFDKLDAREDNLQSQLEREIADGGAHSAKAKKIRKELEAVPAERERLFERERELMDLGLKAETATAQGR